MSTLSKTICFDPGAEALLEDDKNRWTSIKAQGDLPAYYLYTLEIQKSLNDDREYRVIQLENGIEAMLVHDEKTDKAAASLNVAVGYFSDPDDIPGLAHFCEHLLFMGTKQFPKENEYSEYLAKNNGESNAYTGGDDTTFFFSVKSDALKGALERFSVFFHSPLFLENSTMREVLAVDSENSNNLQDDDWRVGQVIRHLARPGHPLRKFGTGNKKTLLQTGRSKHPQERKGSRSSHDSQSEGTRDSGAHNETNASIKAEQTREERAGRETRHRLIKWWEREYGAERMQLVVIGRESLEELTHWVTTLFSPIKNRGQDPLPSLPDDPFKKEQLGSLVYVKTIADTNNVTILMPMLYQSSLWRVKPADFLAHLIGHEGPGSLHAYLKNKGWIIALEVSTEELGRGSSSFELSVDLSKAGLKNYYEVVQACFKYINLLCDSNLPSWCQEELITLQSLEFRFDEKISADFYVQCLLGPMQLPIPRALILSGPRLTWAWDEQLVRQTLSNLVIDNSLVIVTSQDHSIIGKNGPWSKEPWYGTHFAVERIEEGLVIRARSGNDISELSLPKLNEFIPQNFEVKKIDVAQPKRRPALIRRDLQAEVWFKKDDQFWVPRAQVLIEAQTPVICADISSYAMTHLFVDLVEDVLTEYSYDAEIAGLSYSFSADVRSLHLAFGGYSDKLPVLAKLVIEKIRNLDIKYDRLEAMKEKALQGLTNVLLSDPAYLSDLYLNYVLSDIDYTVDEYVSVISDITVEKLRDHVEALLSQLKCKILIDGNFNKEDALALASTFEEIVNAEPLPEKDIIRARTRILPRPCNFVWERTVINPDETNSSVSYYCHIGPISDPQIRVTARVLSRIMEEPAFDILRTKEQLGYTVMASPWEDVEAVGWHIVIQSEKNILYVESRIEAFLVHMRGVLERMDEREFEDHKKALIHQWSEKPKNLMEECGRFWRNIRGGYYDFLRREHDSQVVKAVSKSHVLNMFKEHLDPTSSSRSKLSVHMRSQSPPAHKLNHRAAEKFYSVIQKVGISMDKYEYASLCEELPQAEARGYWEEALLEKLGSLQKVEKVLHEYDKILEKYPPEGQDTTAFNPKPEFIKDGAKFRESLALSAPAKPVEDFEIE